MAGRRGTNLWQSRPIPHTWGVDLADQATWYFLLTHRTVKWWKKLLFGMFEVTFCNALVIYRKLHPGQRTDQNRIRLSIINHLCEGYRRGRARPMVDLSWSFASHMALVRTYPEFVNRVTETAKLRYPDCLVCSKRNKRGEPKTHHTVTTQCNTCKVHLCPVPCFKRYHTMKDYKVTCFKGLHSALYQVQNQ